jgi:hypothetical protein
MLVNGGFGHVERGKVSVKSLAVSPRAVGYWCGVPILHPYLGERRVANQDRRMPAEARKPSAWKADGRWLETKEAGRDAQPRLGRATRNRARASVF